MYHRTKYLANLKWIEEFFRLDGRKMENSNVNEIWLYYFNFDYEKQRRVLSWNLLYCICNFATESIKRTKPSHMISTFHLQITEKQFFAFIFSFFTRYSLGSAKKANFVHFSIIRKIRMRQSLGGCVVVLLWDILGLSLRISKAPLARFIMLIAITF